MNTEMTMSTMLQRQKMTRVKATLTHDAADATPMDTNYTNFNANNYINPQNVDILITWVHTRCSTDDLFYNLHILVILAEKQLTFDK